jgi:hypothetical protein
LVCCHFYFSKDKPKCCLICQFLSSGYLSWKQFFPDGLLGFYFYSYIQLLKVRF